MAPSHISPQLPPPPPLQSLISHPAVTQQQPCPGPASGVSGPGAGLGPVDFVSGASGLPAEQRGSRSSFLACFRLFSTS